MLDFAGWEFFPKPVSEIDFCRYKTFIRSRLNRSLPAEEKTENHHIFPRSFNIQNFTWIDEWVGPYFNVLTLSQREHFIAHLIMWKAFGKEMAQAFFMMSGFSKYKTKLTARQYASLRSEYSNRLSELYLGKPRPIEVAEKIRQTNSVVCASPQFKQKMSAILIARYEDKTNRRKTAELTKKYWDAGDNKEKFSEKRMGSGNPMYGKTHSEEWRLNHSKNQLGKIFVNNGSIQKMVQPYEIEELLNKGWKQGKLPIPKKLCQHCGRMFDAGNFVKHQALYGLTI